MSLDPVLTSALRDALLLALLASLPVIAAALVAGLLLGALQSATQLTDPTVGAVPRLLVVAGALVLAAPWIGARLVGFARRMLEAIASG